MVKYFIMQGACYVYAVVIFCTGHAEVNYIIIPLILDVILRNDSVWHHIMIQPPVRSIIAELPLLTRY